MNDESGQHVRDDGRSRLPPTQQTSLYHCVQNDSPSLQALQSNSDCFVSYSHNNLSDVGSQAEREAFLTRQSVMWSKHESLLSRQTNLCPSQSHHQRRSHSNSLQMFSRVTLILALFLSMSSLSFAHKLPWDSWAIEDTAISAETQRQSLTLKVPDLIAVAGHMFQYQLDTNLIDTRTILIHFQVKIIVHTVTVQY